MRRSQRVAPRIVLMVAIALMAMAVPVAAQDDPATHPLCVLSTDEMSELVGVPIVERAAAGLECAYSADLGERAVQVVLSIIPPDPTAIDPPEDGLYLVRFDGPGGQDGTIGGLPAWISPEGVWIDVGEDVLAVWLNVLFDAAPPPMPATGVAVAEAALPRYLAAPRPSPTPEPPPTGIAARFPQELAGQELDVMAVSGTDLFAQLEAFASGDAARGIADLRAGIEALGVSLDTVEGAFASAFDFEAGHYLSIVAVALPGQEVSSLVEPAIGAFVDFAGGVPEPRTIGGRELLLVAELPGGSDSRRWFLADGDVLWILDGDEALVEALVAALPVPGGGG